MKENGIALNAENDLDVTNITRDAAGRIVSGMKVDNVTLQNAAMIMSFEPGELKEHPTIGVGINKMALDHNVLLYKHRIRQQLTADGMIVGKLEIINTKINIDVRYK